MTTEERLETLERELTASKRRNRRTIIGSIICLGMVVAWALFVQQGQLDALAKADSPATAKAGGPTTAPALDEVRAKAFIMVDDKGKERAKVHMTEYGPALEILDGNSKLCVGLGTINEMPVLAMGPANGKANVALLVDKDGNPSFSLMDKKGQTRVLLATKDAGPMLALQDENGKPRATLGCYSLGLEDENGVPRAAIGIDSISGPGLGLFDDNGKVIWSPKQK